MSKNLTPSALRANLYRILDHVLDTGEPVNIARKGKLLRITPIQPSKLELLKPHPGCINGDPEDLVHMDWSDEWHP